MKHISISMSAVVLGLALAVGTGAALAHDAGHSHGDHAHGPASFDAGQPGDAAAASRRIVVTVHDADGEMRYTPSVVDVRRDEQIEFVIKNEGLLDHEFVVGSEIENAAHAALMQATPNMAHTDPNAVQVKAGGAATFVWKFSKAGAFEFACLIPGHYEAGMRGAANVK